MHYIIERREYEQFEQLRHQILLYNANLDEGFSVEEFVSGLRDDIRSAIWLHHPEDLDTACTLALLQEEELEPFKRKSFFKADGKDSYKASSKGKYHSKFDDTKQARRQARIPQGIPTSQGALLHMWL